jgi:hypothetical protein
MGLKMGKVYYKVVSSDLKSAIINESSAISMGFDFFDDYCIQYIKNEWVKPKKVGTKIMVFDSLDKAEDFLSFQITGDKMRIFTCKVKNPTKNGFITQVSSIDTYYKELFKLISQKKRVRDFYYTVRRSNVPAGTVFCSAVKLLTEIPR